MAKKLKKNATDAKKAGKNMTVKQKNNRQVSCNRLYNICLQQLYLYNKNYKTLAII